jgi:hypothetical protein
VFYSTREDLPDTAIGAFEALVKKVLDIDHSRGIVIGASSDIDHFINECLGLSFDQGDEKHKNNALKLVAKRMDKIRERFNDTVTSIEKIKHVSELGDHHNVYTSVDRLNLLRAMLKTCAEHAAECEAMKEYGTTTVPARNKLAHVRVQKNGFSRKLFDKDGNEITATQMRQLRIDLLNHHERFENLEQKFAVKPGSEKKT